MAGITDVSAALASAERSFDLEEPAEVVRRWWVVAGGDSAVAEADREQASRMAHLTERDWGEPRPIYVPRTGGQPDRPRRARRA